MISHARQTKRAIPLLCVHSNIWVPDLLPSRFASNKEDEEKDSPKKRVFKHGSIEVPNHQKLGKLDTTTEQLDFCLGLTEFVDNYSTTAFTRSRMFVVRKRKPI
jgi:hypothetical protein